MMTFISLKRLNDDLNKFKMIKLSLD